MEKNLKLKIFFIPIIIIVFSISLISSQKQQNIEKHFDLITDKIVNLDGYSFSLSDLDLTLKLIFRDKNFFMSVLQSDHQKLLFQNKYLFDLQYQGLKSYLISYLIKNKELYKFQQSSSDQFLYNKNRLEVIMYDSDFLSIKRINFMDNKNLFVLNSTFNNFINIDFE
ncbi:MAG: hypothetical protein NUV32_03565 [Exilispira sp.]|jgi:hypothetical protein|nr:hypothetical protein [Exilispira sp.]